MAFLSDIKDNATSVANSSDILNRGVDKLRTQFLSGLKTTSSGQKEDPTYTGFRIMFDLGYGGLVDPETFLPISPLLSKGSNGITPGGPRGMKLDSPTDFFHLSRQKMMADYPNYTERLHYMTAEAFLRERRSAAENGLNGPATDNTGKEIPFDSSQLFSGTVSHRADALSGFRNLLTSINEKSPWFIQSIDGLDQILKVPMARQIGGGTGRDQRSGILTFDCLDSIDLRVNAMAELYRKATYDFQYHREMLPANLRKFRMWIIVTEIRQMDLQRNLADVLNPFNLPGVRSATQTISQIAQSAGILKNSATESENPRRDLESLVKSFERIQPYVLIYQLDLCEFNFDETYAFSKLTNSRNDSAVSAKFKVHVGSAKEYKLQYNILSDLIKNQSSLSPILIQDSWNLLGSKILMDGVTLDNNPNLFSRLANNFINNSIASVIQQKVSPLVTGAQLGNAYGFRLSDAIRSLNSVQDLVSGIRNIKSPFEDARPQSKGLGGPLERQYPKVDEDVYPNSGSNPSTNPIGNIFGNNVGNQGGNDVLRGDVYPSNPGTDLGLPNRVYPTIKEDQYRNTGGDLSNRDLGVPDRDYGKLSDDIYKNSPGSDLGLPKRVYQKVNDDSYKDVPGSDLGVPGRVYRSSDGGDTDIYPGVPGSDLGLPQRTYSSNNSDEFKNVPGSDLGVPNRVYPDLNAVDSYSGVPGEDLGLPKRKYPSIDENVYK
jgi:hypothetical protein